MLTGSISPAQPSPVQSYLEGDLSAVETPYAFTVQISCWDNLRGPSVIAVWTSGDKLDPPTANTIAQHILVGTCVCTVVLLAGELSERSRDGLPQALMHHLPDIGYLASSAVFSAPLGKYVLIII